VKVLTIAPETLQTVITVNIPCRLLGQIETVAGYWSDGDVPAWLAGALQAAADGDMGAMHSEFAQRSRKEGQ